LFLHARLSARLPAWASAGASAEELRWLRDGVRLPWVTGPPRPFHQGQSCRQLSDAQRAFLLPELQRCLLTGALEPGTCSRFVTKVFLVPKGDKWRIVFDLRHLNAHVRRLVCRYETLKRLSSGLAKRGDWMVSIDLTDGFHHIPIHPDFRKFLTFDVAGVGLFQFSALPFGLNISPYVFTKVMRTFVRALRAPTAPVRDLPADLFDLARPRRPPRPPTSPQTKYVPPHLRQPPPTAASPMVMSDLLPRFHKLMKKGLRVLPYVDDFAFFFETKADCEEGKLYISAVLDLLGLSRNPKKGVWEPTQMMEHLGIGIDTATGVFFVTPERLSKLQRFAKDLLCVGCSKTTRGLVPKRRLAAFVGLAQSLHLAIPPARYYLRSLHDRLASVEGWNVSVRLDHAAKRDLQWFADLPTKWNGRAIWRSPQTALLHCDASKLAWGAVLNQLVPARGFWTAHERRRHITFLELRAVRHAIESFADRLTGRHVLLREDNQAVCAILTSYTSRSPEMMRELRRLWYLLDTLDVTLLPKYIRSSDNWWADSLSRTLDKGDWRLRRSLFLQLDSDWGPHSIDRFATQLNSQLPRYNSAWMDPETEGLDAFAQTNWIRESNWCNPPWDLLPRLAQLLDESGAPATVIAPCWPAQPWYQQLQSMAIEIRHVASEAGLFCPGRHNSSASAAPPAWSVTCFRIPARQ